MPVVLIRPYTVTSSNATGQDAAPPLGVAYLAASLLEAGCEVKVIDAVGEAITRYSVIPDVPNVLQHGLSDAEIVDRIPEDVEVICVSCMYSLEWIFNRNLINRLREAFPAVAIVVGGEHVTACPDFVLDDCPAVTACSVGEGEATLVELVRVLSRSGNDVDLAAKNLGDVRGVVYRMPDGSIARTNARPRIDDVSTIPRPAWHLIPIAAYLDNGVMTGVNIGRSMPILASRGCPYKCTFCSNETMWGTAWKPRHPDDVIDEMLYYRNEYGATNFDLYDLTAIVRKDWIVQFCQSIIDRGLCLTWQLPSGTRSEAIDEKVCSLLYQSGCRYINYAPESGSPEIISLMAKQVDIENMLESMRAAVRCGLKVKANFIFGIPGETYTTIAETYRYLLRLATAGVHDVSVFPFNPYPGTALFRQLEAEGKVKMGDGFFCALSQCTDPFYPHKSYSSSVSDRALRALTLAAMAMFYSVSFALYPVRLFRMALNIKRKRPATKLETSIERVWTRRRVWQNEVG